MIYGTDGFHLPHVVEVVRMAGATAVAQVASPFGDGRCELVLVRLPDGRVDRLGHPADWACSSAGDLALVPDREPDRIRLYRPPLADPIGEVKTSAAVLALHTAGHRTAAVCADGTVLLIDDPAGTRPVAVVGACAVAVSEDGQRVAVGTDRGRVVVLDGATGLVRHVLRGTTSAVRALAWSPDGGTLVGICGRTALGWPATGGAPVRLRQARHAVALAAITDRSVLLRTAERPREPAGTVAVDPADGRPLWMEPGGGVLDPARPACVLRNGSTLLVGTHGVLREIDPGTGSVLRRLADGPAGERLRPRSVAVHGDTVLVAAVGSSRLHPVDLASGTVRPFVGHDSEDAVRSVHLTRDAFVTGGRSRLRVWRRGRPDPELESVVLGDQGGTVRGVHLTPAAAYGVLGGNVHRVDRATGAVRHSLRVVQPPLALNLVLPVADVLLVVSDAQGLRTGLLALLDPDTLDVRHTEPVERTYDRAVVEGERVLLRGKQGWDVYDVGGRCFTGQRPLRPTPVRYRRGNAVGPDDVEYSTDGGRLAQFRGGELCVGDAAGAAEPVVVHRPLGPVGGRRWFPDDRSLLVWGHNGRLVEVPAPASRPPI